MTGAGDLSSSLQPVTAKPNRPLTLKSAAKARNGSYPPSCELNHEASVQGPVELQRALNVCPLPSASVGGMTSSAIRA